jgi:hypothetical protein
MMQIHVLRCSLTAAAVTGLLLLSQAATASWTTKMGNKYNINWMEPGLHRRLDDVPPWFDRTPAPASPVSSSTTDPPNTSPTDFPTEGETEFITDSPTEGQTEFITDSPTDGASEFITTTIFPTEGNTVSPTSSPTNLTTVSTTVSPTISPTVSPTILFVPATLAPINATDAPTESPTDSPTETPESYVATSFKSNGGEETNCSYVPQSTGESVTETLDMEYFLYLSEVAAPTSDTAAVQSIVDSLQPKLHDTLVDIAFNCSGLSEQAFSIVQLSNDGPGTDLVGASCPLDAGHTAASSCHQVWAQMTVTLWFSGNNSRRRDLQSTPFGGQSAFYQFVDWVEAAFAALPDTQAGILGTEFKGFANLGGFDGTTLSDPQQFGDTTDSFIDSNKSIQNTGLPFSYGHAMIVLAALVMTTLVVLILGRRWRNGRAVRKHLKEVHLDNLDEMEEDGVIVDDASLFQEEPPLPEEFEVQLEDLHHDYRTCASPSCRACLQRKDPQFVLTDLRNMERSIEVHHRRLSPMSHEVDDTQML